MRAVTAFLACALTLGACTPDYSAELQIARPQGISCPDFQSQIRRSLGELPLVTPQHWPSDGWIARNGGRTLLLQYKGSVLAHLYLETSSADCVLKAEWSHERYDPIPTEDNKQMFLLVMKALQDNFGEEAVRITKRGHYFDT